MYKLFELTNGVVDCVVVALNEGDALNNADVKDYFYEEFEEERLEDIDIREIPEDEIVSIEYNGGTTIPLIAKWWTLIYGYDNQIISQSE